jgi:rRNA maturation endonuclease Nob1
MGIREGAVSQSYTAQYEILWSALQEALEALKAKIEHSDYPAGVMIATTGLNFWSAGTRFTISVRNTGGGTAVEISAKPKNKITVVDYGQGTREIQKIFQQLEEILAAAASERPHQETEKTCPACGAKLAKDAKFCPECGRKLED